MIKFFKFVGGPRDGAVCHVSDDFPKDKKPLRLNVEGVENSHYTAQGYETREAQDDTVVFEWTPRAQ